MDDGAARSRWVREASRAMARAFRRRVRADRLRAGTFSAAASGRWSIFRGAESREARAQTPCCREVPGCDTECPARARCAVGRGPDLCPEARPRRGMVIDDAWYVMLAKALAEGRGYRLVNAPIDGILPGYPPGFPALLSLVFHLSPDFPGNVWLLKSVSMAAMFGVGDAELLLSPSAAAAAPSPRRARVDRYRDDAGACVSGDVDGDVGVCVYACATRSRGSSRTARSRRQRVRGRSSR